MKIGLSFSRCIRDIVDGVVNIDDVLVVIARTDFDPRDAEQWKGIWSGYGGGGSGGGPWSMPEWGNYAEEDEDRFRSASIELWECGKLFQPRRYGAHPRRLPYHWLETILPKEELEKNPSAKKAFEHFQMIAGLISRDPVKFYNENE